MAGSNASPHSLWSVPEISTVSAHPFALGILDKSNEYKMAEIRSNIYRYFPAVRDCLNPEEINEERKLVTVNDNLQSLFGIF